MGTPLIKAAANIAIVWGTKNATNNAVGFIIETLTVTPKNGEPVDIEDGEGFTLVQAMCNDGFNGKASCIYDSNKALPAEGATVTLVAPKIDGNAGTRNINCTYWSHGFTKTKKKEQMVELTITHRPDLNT